MWVCGGWRSTAAGSWGAPPGRLSGADPGSVLFHFPGGASTPQREGAICPRPQVGAQPALELGWSALGDVLQTVPVPQDLTVEMWTEHWPRRHRDCRYLTVRNEARHHGKILQKNSESCFPDSRAPQPDQRYKKKMEWRDRGSGRCLLRADGTGTAHSRWATLSSRWFPPRAADHPFCPWWGRQPFPVGPLCLLPSWEG